MWFGWRDVWRSAVVVPLALMVFLFLAAAYVMFTADRCGGEVMGEQDICLLDTDPGEELVRPSDESVGPYRGHTRAEKRQTSMIMAGAFLIIGVAAGAVAVRQLTRG
ncbi:hypothetical protein IU433_26420 [Nocardia puris]|uniref:Uncharacterized protein n=1 Tax=Nocardia puris TaxID=208602 RepID=A0A366D2A3_9NOCA|nr:hypothetical protein [Nocardia puris]MBF6215124.1 hypothetical protein [Nocardia puris]MBF6369635.1 hypothetical protein [Nocardia puris]MBF6462550.1 hypothetical protein [Nocardia puris]RBO83639.1 hypothetical protein DFR74_11863 [Nocardia puris]